MKHLHTDQPKCPHCNHEIKNYWDFAGEDGSQHEIECPECEEMFYVEVSVNYSFSSKKPQCSDEHEWGASRKHVVDQRTCERWNKEGFLGKRNYVPHTNWSRRCVNCDHETFFRNANGSDLSIDSIDPWEVTK
jgi:hypothetical protein